MIRGESMARKFKHWAYLNEEGKKLYGEIYPDGEVPVLSMIPGWQKLEGISEPQQCYMVYLDELTDEQFEKTVDIFHQKSGVPKDIIRKEIREIGLPLRVKYVSGAGTNHPGFLLP